MLNFVLLIIYYSIFLSITVEYKIVLTITYFIFLCYSLKVMDKEWTKLPWFSQEYIDGVDFFLDFAYIKGRPQGDEIVYGKRDMWFMIT